MVPVGVDDGKREGWCLVKPGLSVVRTELFLAVFPRPYIAGPRLAPDFLGGN